MIDFKQQTNTIGLYSRKITLVISHMKDGV